MTQKVKKVICNIIYTFFFSIAKGLAIFVEFRANFGRKNYFQAIFLYIQWETIWYQLFNLNIWIDYSKLTDLHRTNIGYRWGSLQDYSRGKIGDSFSRQIIRNYRQLFYLSHTFGYQEKASTQLALWNTSHAHRYMCAQLCWNLIKILLFTTRTLYIHKYILCVSLIPQQLAAGPA
jgi:hypothetical protein